ncbi:MAG: DUF2059 domain-containing protein [Terriglobales bacterium]
MDLFVAKVRSKVNAQTFAEIAVPIYDKYFSDEEIKGLIHFYGTSLGAKTLTVLPNLLRELQEEGSKWGVATGRESMLEVLVEHPELAKALQDAQNASKTR